MDLASHIRNIADFPKPGIQFKDVTTLLLVPEAFRFVIDAWHERYKDYGAHAIVGIDARGFIFGAALAYAMGLPFVPIRKKGKLPGDCLEEEYELEYGTSILEVHVDALKKGEKVIIIDDLLATGGTVAAVRRMLDKLGVEVLEAAFVVELPTLHGRKALEGLGVHALVEFHVDE
jgi:adenine phosphoribosyltransferase